MMLTVGSLRISKPQGIELVSEDKLEGVDGGAWTEEIHQTLYPGNFNEGLARYICSEIKPGSVLEFGSGLGYLARYIVDHSDVERYDCVEPNEMKGCYRETSSPRLFPVDIFKDRLEGLLLDTYELIASIEVAEHIPRSRHSELFDFLASHAAKTVVFSGARVGQGGHGHIAERPEHEWKQEFLDRGCRFLPEQTEAIRAACDTKNINHRQNLMVFAVGQQAN